MVRRDGVFTNARASNNFNEQLIEPVIRHLAGPWESVFARRMPGILNSLPANAGQILTTFHDEVERRAVRNGVSVAPFHMLKHQIAVYKETLKDAISEARGMITEKQRNINREFEPRVLEHMLSVYQTCTAETGPGQYSRMKGYMSRHVDEEKSIMFDDAVEHVRGLLKQMLKEVKESLLGKVDAIFMAIGRDYTGVVVGKDQGKSKEVLPRDQRMARKAVLGFIDSAEMIFKRAVGLEPEQLSEPQANTSGKIVSDGNLEVKAALDTHPEVKPEPSQEPSAIKQEPDTVDPANAGVTQPAPTPAATKVSQDVDMQEVAAMTSIDESREEALETNPMQ